MILVDTNVWSETTKNPCNPRVAAWLVEHASQTWLSVLVIAEIRMGIELPEAASKRPDLEEWLATMEEANAERTLSFDSTAAHMLGGLLARRNAETKILDMMLAAQGLARDAPVATRNLKDFEWTGVKLINPWES